MSDTSSRKAAYSLIHKLFSAFFIWQCSKKKWESVWPWYLKSSDKCWHDVTILSLPQKVVAGNLDFYVAFSHSNMAQWGLKGSCNTCQKALLYTFHPLNIRNLFAHACPIFAPIYRTCHSCNIMAGSPSFVCNRNEGGAGDKGKHLFTSWLARCAQ